MAATDKDYDKKRKWVTTIDHRWGFNNNDEVVWSGFRQWWSNGFVRMPTKEEAMAIDDDWFDDLQTARNFVQYVKDSEKNRRGKGALSNG